MGVCASVATKRTSSSTRTASISSNSVLREETMRIFVVIRKKGAFKLNVSRTDRIKFVKTLLFANYGIGIAYQTLYYATENPLEDDKTLSDYNIQPGGSIYLNHHCHRHGGRHVAEEAAAEAVDQQRAAELK